ncbi:MAG TPA: alpha-amylase family protein [Chloroflexota bacterium]|jgi:hypothetical protein|nr:alpha-amylase family protein [Chloroflexota bacterium]
MAIESTPTWLGEDLVRGMPHFISPAWVKDRSHFDAAATAAAWEKIGFEVVHFLTKHHDGFMLWPSEFCPDDQPEIDYFGQQVAECARRGIKSIAYYSVGHDNWAGSKHPEWLVRDQHGDLPDTSGWNSPTWMCLSSGYADFALGQMEELAREYEISGLWLDICGLPVDENYCFCDNCRRGFTEWAGAANLDNMKGSEEMWQYKLHIHSEFVKKTRAVLVKHGRDPVVIFNGAGAPYNKRYAQRFEGSDSESSECHDPLLVGTIGRLHRNMHKPFELLSCSETTWVHPVLKPDTLVELEAFAATAHGGTYTVGITHTPEGWLSPGNIDRLAAITSKVKANRDLLIGTEPIYDVGVVSSWDNREMRRVMPQIWRWVDFVRQGHFLFNVLPGFHNLEAQRVVIIPGGLHIGDDDADRLRRYVEGGGNLIVESPTPRRGGDGGYLLADLLGVEYDGLSESRWHFMEPTDDALREDGMTDDPLMAASTADIVTLNGAETVTNLVHQFVPMDLAHMVWTQANAPQQDPAAEPGITIHRLGKGSVAFSVCQLSSRDPKDDTSPWLTTLSQNLVELMLGERSLELTAGPLVEVVANRQGDRAIVHLLNHAYGPAPALRTWQASDVAGAGYSVIQSRGETDFTAALKLRLNVVRLGLKPTSVTVVPDGESLEIRGDGDWVEVTVPPLGIHKTLVIE